MIDPGLNAISSLAQLNVALIGADNVNAAEDVQSKLLPDGRIASVTSIEAGTITPTTAE